ncbi:Hsp20/alpha crystallin family protein [Thermodesulfobacteriota bacterium]
MSNLVSWHEYKELDHFKNEMDRLFDRFFERGPNPLFLEGSEWTPPVDISETPSEVIVHAEIPGIDVDDVKISLDGRVLKISGEKKRNRGRKDARFRRLERKYGAFNRLIELPADVLSNQVKAIYDRGVLYIRLPKSGKQSFKKIEVRSS